MSAQCRASKISTNARSWYPLDPRVIILGAPIRRASGASFQLAVAADQVVGGAVMLQHRLRCTLELGDDALGQDLAQLDAPLVEGIDLPDRTLSEDVVLVEGDQLAQRRRGQTVQQQSIGGPVALEEAMGHQPV